MSLQAQELHFTYPRAGGPILAGFSAEFAAGRITAVSGPMGCGKTTLGKLLVGILKPQQGRVVLDGADIASLSLAEIGRRIGYVMQNPQQQLFCPSVAEEVRFGLINAGLAAAEIEARLAFYLDYFHLLPLREAVPFRLSLGERQRLVLAAMLSLRPAYLILDEPTASLDVYRRRLLGEYLQKTASELGCGIIVFSHDQDFIDLYAETLLAMEEVALP